MTPAQGPAPAAYSLLMLAALATAVILSRRQAPVPGLSPAQRMGIGLGAFCGAMLGAKLPFVLADWEGLRTGWAWFSSGKTILFGIVGGYAGVELAKAWLGVRVKTGDHFAVPVAAAVGVGRLACYAGGCCYGIATRLPWGVDFGDGVPRHPTQLYEAVFHLGMSVFLACCGRRGWLPGQRIKLYILAYLGYRFMTEWIRPEPRIWLGLTLYQWSALALIPVFVWLWRHDAARLDAGGREVAAGTGGG